MIKLRDYQQKGKDLISQRFSMGENRVMLWAMTGAGKGLWMADFINECNLKGMRSMSVMKRREIIFQTVNNYKKYYGIDSNEIMGNLKNTNKNLSTVASIDTLRNRIKNPKYQYLRECPFVIIDECHDFTSPTYRRFAWFLEGYNLNDFSEAKFEQEKEYFKKIYIGMTATPFRVGKKTHTFWQSVVKPIEAHELMNQGYLVRADVYAPKKIDTSGLRVNPLTGDFDEKQVFERVSKLEVIGDVVKTYKKFGENLPAICFCVNQQHSKIMAEAFRRAGIPAIHCDADHDKSEREEAVNGLKSGKYKIITNCNIFSTGFDAPFIGVVISARPSDSENLVIQQWGRGLRPYKVCANCQMDMGGPGNCYFCGSSVFSYIKKRCIILDHANNTSRWGLPYDVREPELEPIDRVRKSQRIGIGVKDCPKCFAVLHSNERFCVCGHDFVAASQQNALDQVNHVGGELSIVDKEFLKQQTYQKIKQRYNTYKRLEMLKNWDQNAKYFKLYQDFGEELFRFSSEFGISVKVKKMLQDRAIESGIKGLFDNAVLKNEKIIT